LEAHNQKVLLQQDSGKRDSGQTGNIPQSQHKRFTQIPSGFVKNFLLGQRAARSIREADPHGILKDIIAELARHPEGSQPYNLAVINLLLRMKERGLDINEMSADGPLSDLRNALPQGVRLADNGDTLVCKTIPYNICYKLKTDGSLSPLTERRPLRILRVYKRNGGGERFQKVWRIPSSQS